MLVFIVYLHKYSLDFAFLVGFGEHFGEQNCRFCLYFQGVRIGKATKSICSRINLSEKCVYTFPTSRSGLSPIQISTISGRTYCWHIVANVCRKQYAVLSASNSFITSFIFNRCKSAVKGLSQSINPCACVGMGIFLYSIFPFLRLRLRAIRNSPSRWVSSSISQGLKVHILKGKN